MILPRAPSAHTARPLLEIGLATFALLALELALIRWISGQVRILAYFNNLILICCFAGIGIGVLAGPRHPRLARVALPLLALLSVVLALSERLGLMHLRFPDPSVFLWGAESSRASVLESVGTIAAIVGLAGAVMACLALPATIVGALFDARRGDPRAYTADLLGSLLGVVAFSACTALSAPPPVWLALAVLPLIAITRTPLAVASGLVALVAATASIDDATFSPYNRIDVSHDGPRRIKVSVNRDYHQVMHDLRNAPVDDAEAALIRAVYDLPFAGSAPGFTAIVVGAGTGNDVAAALRADAGSIESVDIDARLIELGQRLHPDQPYADARVHAIVDDARAFYAQRTGPPVDVVVFGYVDSHAMFSSMSSLRLDNYVYTVEGLRAAWRHVGPKGHLTVCMSLLAGPWLAERIYATLADATGTTPLFVPHGLHRGGTFIAARDPATLERFARLPIAGAATSLTPNDYRQVSRTTDEWPFLYLQPGAIPWVYPFILALVAALTLLGVRVAAGTTLARSFDLPLFLLGAAFLLLETRAVTASSVLFGSTWVVNAAVFAGVLIAALCANLLVERRGAVPLRPAFAALVASVVVVYVVDTAALAALPTVARGLAAGLLHGLPIGVAGLIVSSLFVRSADLAGAFASNLLGAVLGGCLEYLSMAIGLRSLVLVALALYLAAGFVVLRRATNPHGERAPPGT
ncbi:MAG: hypothetical protein IT383_16955 [Deltaproteobacteria bacterium]|nr:hypothetical protein [Deltaproteobacteria bacterium]